MPHRLRKSIRQSGLEKLDGDSTKHWSRLEGQTPNNSTIHGTKCCCQSEWRKYRTMHYSPRSEIGMSVITNNLYNAEAIEREAIEDVDEGLKVGGQLPQTIKFADDQAVLADTERGLQEMMDKMNESVERH